MKSEEPKRHCGKASSKSMWACARFRLEIRPFPCGGAKFCPVPLRFPDSSSVSQIYETNSIIFVFAPLFSWLPRWSQTKHTHQQSRFRIMRILFSNFKQISLKIRKYLLSIVSMGLLEQDLNLNVAVCASALFISVFVAELALTIVKIRVSRE